MASPPLAKLDPREPELASAKQSWVENRPLGSRYSYWCWGCNPFPSSWGGSVPQAHSPRQCWLSGSHS